jgi:hypothetical protein
LQDKKIQPMSDWGSGGRRLNPVRPTTVQKWFCQLGPPRLDLVTRTFDANWIAVAAKIRLLIDASSINAGGIAEH